MGTESARPITILMNHINKNFANSYLCYQKTMNTNIQIISIEIFHNKEIGTSSIEVFCEMPNMARLARFTGVLLASSNILGEYYVCICR